MMMILVIIMMIIRIIILIMMIIMMIILMLDNELYQKGHLDNLLLYLWNEVAAYISETIRESVESARPVQNGLV